MPIFRLFKFVNAAVAHARLEPDLARRAGDSAARHRSYHWRVVCIAIATGIMIGVSVTYKLLHEKSDDGLGKYHMYVAPFFFGAVGVVLGAALGCLIAPREFLVGPIGERWMSFIGVKRPVLARFVCGAAVLILAAILVLLLLGGWLQTHGILPPPRPRH